MHIAYAHHTFNSGDDHKIIITNHNTRKDVNVYAVGWPKQRAQAEKQNELISNVASIIKRKKNSKNLTDFVLFPCALRLIRFSHSQQKMNLNVFFPKQTIHFDNKIKSN